MKRFMLTAWAVILVFGLTACKNGQSADTSAPPASPSETQETSAADISSNSEETFTLTLYADFSNGVSGGEVKEKVITLPLENEPYSQSLIAFILADELSEWTGLDFALNDVFFPDYESVEVDWSKDATLIAGLDDREFKEGFRFSDTVSLNWFMMDSLATTLKNNMTEKTSVYYLSDAQPITFPNPEDMAAEGLPELPIDQPYEGSAFFVSHAGGAGDMGADGGIFVENQEQAEKVLMEITAVEAKNIEDNPTNFGTVAYVFKNEGVIDNDQKAWYFDLGSNTNDKFTAEYHYAVDETGTVWLLDLAGDWCPLTVNEDGSFSVG